MRINFISSLDTDEFRIMYLKSNNAKIMKGTKTNDIINKLFESTETNDIVNEFF